MNEFVDMRIEILKVSDREVVKLKKWALGTDWGYRISRYFGPTTFILTRRFNREKYACIVTDFILQQIGRRTKKTVRVHLTHQKYWEL